MPKLTKEFVERAAPGGYKDSDLRGFELRVGKTGVRTFCVRYRPKAGGRRPCVKIGRYGVITPIEARNEARRILGLVAAGADPSAEAAEAKSAITSAELAERFLADEVAPKRSRGTFTLYSIYLNKHVIPEIGRDRAESVTRAAIAKLHVRIGKSHPPTANRVLATLSGLFSFGIARGLLPASFINPAKGIEKFKETARERFLTAEEFERLGAALREAETVGLPYSVDETKPNAKHAPKPERRITIVSPFACAAIRLLIFTGCRLREILHLRWTSVDVERGMLHLPTSKTGKKSIVLNAPALEILSALPRLSDFVIAGDDPAKPRTDLHRPWAVITRRAQLGSLRIHDLRHAYASVAVSGGLGLPIVSALLGHRSVSSTQRYAHLHNDPLLRATEKVGATISAWMRGKSSENVVPLAPSLSSPVTKRSFIS